MNRDRRAGTERRTNLRYAAQIEIKWESSAGKQSGTISDISETGCFVLCSGAVKDGEKIKLFLPAKRQQTVTIRGEVISHIYEIGCAVRFIEIGYSERMFLERLLAYLKQTTQPI